MPKDGLDTAPTVGISSCLLGENVRYDGGNKRDAYITETLAQHFSLVPVCPEMDLGLGVPREALCLIDNGSGIRMVGSETGIDHTDAMHTYAGKRCRSLRELGLRGFVLKTRSPSCGPRQVEVHSDKPRISLATAPGLFAHTMLRAFPVLPVEDEVGLANRKRREHFIACVFAYDRLSRLFDGSWSTTDLREFYRREATLLRAHDSSAASDLERIIAETQSAAGQSVRSLYEERFMQALLRRGEENGRHTRKYREPAL